jgi:hypothetical protein
MGQRRYSTSLTRYCANGGDEVEEVTDSRVG